MKRLLCITLSLIMIFAFIACSGGENVDEELEALNAYKATAKADLEEYVNSLTKTDYSDITWAAMLEIATAGKQAVEDATTKPLVDTAVEKTKAAINMGIFEVEVNDIIELHTWYPTSGISNNMITFNYENAVFECNTDYGSFGYGVDAPKSITMNSGDRVHWQNLGSPNNIPHAFIDVIVKIYNNIVGYAVIEVYLKSNEPYSPTNDARVLESRIIPKINGQFQTVTYELAAQTIEQIKIQKGHF